MPNKVVFRPEAKQDILEIHLYIAQHAGLRTASDYIARIETACLSLTEFPRKGVARDDLAPGIRTLSFERRAVIA